MYNYSQDKSDRQPQRQEMTTTMSLSLAFTGHCRALRHFNASPMSVHCYPMPFWLRTYYQRCPSPRAKTFKENGVGDVCHVNMVTSIATPVLPYSTTRYQCTRKEVHVIAWDISIYLTYSPINPFHVYSAIQTSYQSSSDG
jgi:hypothetical protein